MSGKRIVVGGVEYGLEDGQVDTVVDLVRNALESGTVAALPLLDAKNRAVTVYLNGRVADAVMIDLDGGPRPTEIC